MVISYTNPYKKGGDGPHPYQRDGEKDLALYGKTEIPEYIIKGLGLNMNNTLARSYEISDLYSGYLHLNKKNCCAEMKFIYELPEQVKIELSDMGWEYHGLGVFTIEI
jgi:hypothetical protein